MSYLIPENSEEEMVYTKDYFDTVVGRFGVSGFNLDGQEVGEFCYVCKSEFNGITNCKLHFDGKRHAAKLKQYNDAKVHLIIDPLSKPDASENSNTDDPDNMVMNKYCKICEAELNTFEQRESHYNSEKHQRRVRHYVFMQMGIRDVNTSHNMAGKINEDPSELSQMEYCHLCKIELSAPVVAQAHYKGKRHARKLKEKREREMRNDVNNTDLYCSVCDVLLNSEIQFNQHMESLKHLKKEKMSTELLDQKIRELERKKEEIRQQRGETSKNSLNNEEQETTGQGDAENIPASEDQATATISKEQQQRGETSEHLVDNEEQATTDQGDKGNISATEDQAAATISKEGQRRVETSEHSVDNEEHAKEQETIAQIDTENIPATEDQAAATICKEQQPAQVTISKEK